MNSVILCKNCNQGGCDYTCEKHPWHREYVQGYLNIKFTRKSPRFKVTC